MRAFKKAACLAVAASATLAVTALAGPALADPPSGTTPTGSDIVGVGSNTTEQILDNYSTSYNGTGPTRKLYSWDSVPAGTITTKSTCTSGITRPNGSGAGITALVNDPAAYNANGTCVDFARSSRARTSTDTNDITFIAFAKDVVTWAAVKPGTTKFTPKNLSTSQLSSIYSCSVTDWHTLNSALASGTIEPYLPQASSGTRQAFLIALTNGGNTKGTNAPLTPGPCVRQPAALEENSGTSLQANLQSGDSLAQTLVPYSAGKWVAQSRGGDQDLRNGFTAREINTVPSVTPDVANGAAGPYSLNTSGQYVRLLYNVVKNKPGGGLDQTSLSAINTNLATIFGVNGFICNHPLGVNDGFVSLPKTGSGTLCGAKS